MNKKDVKHLAIGALAGAALGVLFAPKKGEATRKDIKKKAKEVSKKVKNFDIEKAKKEVNKKIEQINKEVQDLDKEKVLSIAKDKASSIRESADKLVSYAKEKGNEALEDTANKARKSTIDALNKIIKKLEK